MQEQIRPQPPADSDTTDNSEADDLARDRPLIARIEYVFDHILSILPVAAKKDVRYKIISQLMKDSLIDISLVPDRIIQPLMRECGQALMFIADGDMEELQMNLAALAENRDIPDE
jgi:hypothetical protein